MLRTIAGVLLLGLLFWLGFGLFFEVILFQPREYP